MNGAAKPLQADLKIGFVGAGRMAQALAKGINNSKQFASTGVSFVDPNDEAVAVFLESHPSAIRRNDLASLMIHCELIVLAVKPQAMSDVLIVMKDFLTQKHLIVSVAAGITLNRIQTALNTDRIVRVMPNTPCLIGKGMSAIAAHAHVSESDRQTVNRIMQSVGKVIEIAETQIDAVTGLSGSGPAYVFYFLESLVDAGIHLGLPASVAQELSLQTLAGAVALVEATGKSPEELRRQVSSPGGTTLAGLEILEKQGLAEVIQNAVSAATQRSVELSRS